MAPSPKVLKYFSVMASSLLNGVYAVLILLVCWILKTRRRSMPTTHKILFGASITMWFIAVAHLGLLMQEASVGFTSRPVGKAVVLLVVFQFVIGDLILIWRVWVIWNRNYLIVAGPFCLMVIAAAFTGRLVVESHKVSFSTVASVLIVCNTSICTLLIAGRVWYMSYRLRRFANTERVFYPSQTFSGAVALLVESGAFYAVSHLISLILYLLGSDVLPVVLNLQTPLIGILPTLIIVLVHFNMVPGTETSRSYVTTLNWHTATDITLDTIITGNLTITPGNRRSKAIQIDVKRPESPSECDGVV